MTTTLVTTTALYGLHAEGRELFGYMLRVSLAISYFRDFLGSFLANNPGTTQSNKILIGDDNPNNPDAASYYYVGIHDFLANIAEGGVDIRRVRNSFFLHLYDLWEDKYRKLIAEEVGLDNRGEIGSDFFADLRSYRHGITHSDGVLKRNPRVLPFCTKGEPIHLSGEDTNELFRTFVNEMNRLGEVYYKVNPRFTYTWPVN